MKKLIVVSPNFCSAEALDNHLTAVQQDRELRSQIEERKIRSDAAYEEAKRKEKALQEEKLRKEKAKAEAEVYQLYLSVGCVLVFQLKKIICILSSHSI